MTSTDHRSQHSHAHHDSAEFAHTSVLIVEDDPSYRFLLRGVCTQIGIGRIEEAEDGAEGWDATARMSPDVILLDVMMPRVDGIELCRRLRADPRTANVAILIQTSLTDDATRAKCYEAGATDVVSKPLDLAEFTARLQTHLRAALHARRLSDFRQRINTHLEIAHGFMLALLPDVAQARDLAAKHGFEFSVSAHAPKEVSSNLWYLREVGPSELMVMMIAANAEGLAGTINALRVDTVLRELWGRHRQPQQLLHALDRTMAQSPCGRLFAGVTAAILDGRNGQLWYAASGNPYPIICHGGQAKSLPSGGVPLGSGMVTSESSPVALNTDDTLVLHTKGWPSGNTDPLTSVTRALAAPRMTAESLLGRDHGGDDVTLITLRRTGGQPAAK